MQNIKELDSYLKDKISMMTLSSFSFSTGLRIGETLALNNVNENYIEINKSASE